MKSPPKSSNVDLNYLSELESISSGTLRQWLAGLVVSLGVWILGSTEIWPPALNPDYEDWKIFSSTAFFDSFLVACLVGCLLGGYLVTHVGRRISMLLVSVPFLIGWLFLSSVTTRRAYISAYAILGVFGSATAVCVLLCIYEICKQRLRTKILSCCVIMYYLGAFYTVCLGANANWHITDVTAGFLLVPMFIVLYWLLPETPQCFLTAAGKRTDASKASQGLGGKQSEAEVEEELQKLEHKIPERRLMSSGNQLEVVLIYAGCAFFAQFSGWRVVSVFRLDFFVAAESNLEVHETDMIYVGVKVLATILGAALLHRFGSKLLFLVSQLCTCVCILGLGIYFSMMQKGTLNENTPEWLPLFLALAFILSFHIGAGLLQWVLMVDLFPERTNGVTVAASAALYFLLSYGDSNFLDRLLFKEENMEVYTIFMIYAGINAVGAAYMAILLQRGNRNKTKYA